MVGSFSGKAWEHSSNRKYVSETKGKELGGVGSGRDFIFVRTSVRKDIDHATFSC